MNLRSIETTLQALRRHLLALERDREKTMAAIHALDDLRPKDDAHPKPKGRPARKRRPTGGPLVDGALFVLKTATGPMHIMDLVADMQGNGVYRNRAPEKLRASLVSTLRRRTDLFSNPTRGFYGLNEWPKKQNGDPE